MTSWVIIISYLGAGPGEGFGYEIIADQTRTCSYKYIIPRGPTLVEDAGKRGHHNYMLL